MIGKYGYTLREIPRGGLESFIRESNFLGLNVTIPYKQEIMPLLDEIDTTAKDIGAVNTRCAARRQAVRVQHRF